MQWPNLWCLSFDLYPRRGLNPPHRVKSISMTTFTQQEIEFLQKHSNEVLHALTHYSLCTYWGSSNFSFFFVLRSANTSGWGCMMTRALWSQISVNLRKSKSFFRRNMRRKDGKESLVRSILLLWHCVACCCFFVCFFALYTYLMSQMLLRWCSFIKFQVALLLL